MAVEIMVSRAQLEYISKLLTADEANVQGIDELEFLAGCARDTLEAPEVTPMLHGWCL